MFFSKLFFRDSYNIDTIQKFYTLLTQEFSDVELNWKTNTSLAFNPEDSNFVQIKVNDKTLFTQSKDRAKGALTLANADGKLYEVMKAFVNSGFSIDEPEVGNSYILLLIYAILLGVVLFMRPEEIFLIILSTAVVIGGISTFLYSISLKRFIDSDFFMAKLSSSLIMICFLATAPSSLTTMSFFSFMNEKAFYNMIQKFN